MKPDVSLAFAFECLPAPLTKARKRLERRKLLWLYRVAYARETLLAMRPPSSRDAMILSRPLSCTTHCQTDIAISRIPLSTTGCQTDIRMEEFQDILTDAHCVDDTHDESHVRCRQYNGTLFPSTGETHIAAQVPYSACSDVRMTIEVEQHIRPDIDDHFDRLCSEVLRTDPAELLNKLAEWTESLQVALNRVDDIAPLVPHFWQQQLQEEDWLAPNAVVHVLDDFNVILCPFIDALGIVTKQYREQRCYEVHLFSSGRTGVFPWQAVDELVEVSLDGSFFLVEGIVCVEKQTIRVSTLDGRSRVVRYDRLSRYRDDGP